MEISIIVWCLILCAFFSGMEIAFVSSNKIYLEIEKKQDNFISKTLSKLTENPSKFIAAMLIGKNIGLVIYAFLMGDLVMVWIENLGFHFSEFWNILLQTIISTILILATAEFLSKVFFQIYANILIKVFALPAYGFYLCFTTVKYAFTTNTVYSNSDLAIKTGSALSGFFSSANI